MVQKWINSKAHTKQLLVQGVGSSHLRSEDSQGPKCASSAYSHIHRVKIGFIATLEHIDTKFIIDDSVRKF